MTHRRNHRRRNLSRGLVTASREVAIDKANAYRTFWLTTEPTRQQHRDTAAVYAASKAFDEKRAAKNLPARPWRPWRKSVSR